MEKIKKMNRNSKNGIGKMELLRQENEKLKNKLAELSAEMKQFTYIVSHDLQAPLRSITGFVELLKKRYSDKLDEAAGKFIDYAIKGTNQVKTLISDLLEYSRLTTDTKELSEVDLNIILEEVTEKLMPIIKGSGATITTGHLPVVIAKRDQMEQLFHRLIDNSLKFRDHAAPEISIDSEKQNGFWEISIKDNGLGIESEYLDKIFIIFRRLHGDETKYAGRGYGLAACKKIVELHGGSIHAKSEMGKGSTFIFTLPEKKQ